MRLSFKCRKCHEYGNFLKIFPIEATDEPGKSQEKGWQQAKRGKKELNNSPNVNNDHHPKNFKEKAITAKDMGNNNPFTTLHIKEGEIPTVDITSEGEEMEEGGEPDPSTLPNAGIEGLENDLTGSSFPGGSWVAMVKKKEKI